MPPPCLRLTLAPILLVIAGMARADCIDDAAAHHQVNALVLRAIGWHESHLDPAAVGHNANGTVDIGAFQINSVHLPDLARYGVTSRLLTDGCVSAYVAAWHYRRQMDRFGNTWSAIGAYHSHTPSRAAWYANRIAAILMAWRVLPFTSPPFAESLAQAPAVAAAPDVPFVRRPFAQTPSGAQGDRELPLFDALPPPSPVR
jgi:hypothetical protein